MTRCQMILLVLKPIKMPTVIKIVAAPMQDRMKTIKYKKRVIDVLQDVDDRDAHAQDQTNSPVF